MRFRPDNLPDMVKDEARNVVFKLGGAIGPNTIDTFEVESCPSGLTFGTPNISGTNVTVLTTAAQTGTFTIIPTGELSSGETVKGMVQVKVVDCDSATTHY